MAMVWLWLILVFQIYKNYKGSAQIDLSKLVSI